MPVLVTLDAMLEKRGVKGKDLAAKVGLSQTQLSMIRSGKVRGLRFATLAKICLVLNCRPADLLDYDPSQADLDE